MMDKELESKMATTVFYQMPSDRFYQANDPSTKVTMDGRVMMSPNDEVQWRPDPKDGVYKNNQFMGGNIRGIIEKLPYLHKMKFTGIYLTPICYSSTNHRYNSNDQEMIDPMLGTWKDFRELCSKALELGIFVMVDLAFNHCGIDSKYIKDPKYKCWLKHDQNGNQCYWWGFKDLPEMDCECKEYQNAMEKVVEKYLENGASFIRLDLGEDLPKSFLLKLQEAKKKYPNCKFIGEMWQCALDKSDSKIFDGQLDSVMNYYVADANLRLFAFNCYQHYLYRTNRIYSQYPEEAKRYLLNNLGTHDTARTLNMLYGYRMNRDVFRDAIWNNENEYTQKGKPFDTFYYRSEQLNDDKKLTPEVIKELMPTLKMSLAVMYFQPGIPCVYYGTEILMHSGKDPFNRAPFQWDKVGQETEMIQYITALNTMRQENADVFYEVDYKNVCVDGRIVVIERYTRTGESMILACNQTDEVQDLRRFNLGNYKVILSENGSNQYQLQKKGLVILRR